MKIFEPGLALVLAFVMALVHFLGEEIEQFIEGFKEQIVSFSAGVSISYIFVQLLPEFHRIAVESSKLIFMAPLLGFSSMHLIEKYLAQAELPEEKVRRDFGELHFGFLMLYHGAMGYLIASLISKNIVSGILFFLPIILHLAVSSLSISELHEKFAQRKSVKALASLSPLIGVIIYNLGILTRSQFNPLFGAVIGMFFYVVIRDSIPSGEKGKPLEYLIGMLIYLSIILTVQTL